MKPPAVRTRALALDAGAIAVVSAAIAAASDRLAFMSALVPAVLALRTLLWTRLPGEDRPHGLGAEIAFLVLCAALGGFNDWNSVVRHRIYDYTVPADLPRLSTIPSWMLLYWGMILRALATLARWKGLGGEDAIRDEVRLGRRTVRSPALRVGVLLALALLTRQAIYRLYLDPVGSWLPFAVALGLYAALLRPGRREVRLAAAALVLGPALEALYIGVGGLHRYRLGLVGGVPAWIVLWWVLAAWIWSDLSARILARLSARYCCRRAASLSGFQST